MSIKNNKVYIFAIIIFIWNILYNYLQNTTNYYNILNFIFWISILIISIITFNKGYKRYIYKDIIFKDIIIFTLLYIIIYYLLGFIVGFQKSPLNFELFNIIKNLTKYVILKIIIESIKYYLIKENNKKKFIIIITIIFIIINIDINYLINLIEVPKELFKYISNNIVPISVYGIIGTYIIKNSNINVSSYIKFTIKVKIDSLKSINSNISNTDTLTIKIPLLQPTFKIDVNKSVSNNRDIYLLTKKESNNLFLKIGILGITLTIITSLVLFIIYKNTRTKIEIYKEERNNLLKKYEEIIITIEKLPNIDELETIEITEFNDLIDLEETLKLPIMYINIIPNKESWFILIHNNFFYRYILKIK